MPWGTIAEVLKQAKSLFWGHQPARDQRETDSSANISTVDATTEPILSYGITPEELKSWGGSTFPTSAPCHSILMLSTCS
jgi:hypothetical protein